MLDFFRKLIPQEIKNFYHLLQAVGASVFFGFPGKKMTVIGITGTNGKTTTCQLVAKILEKAGYSVALASTINFKIKEKEWVNKTKFTTVSAWQTQKFLSQALAAGCQYVVLETSSHSLDQYRVWGIDYAVAVLTNLTREHLDYHQTMEKYCQAKIKLFKKAKVAIVNLESAWAGEFLKMETPEKWGYFFQIPNSKFQISNKFQVQKLKIIKAEDAELKTTGAEFIVQGINFELQLLGKFNVENALAAISVGLSQGIDLATASAALKEIKKVPGRLDEVENRQGIKILIDYALTPDSMEQLGELVKHWKTVSNRLIWIFGACGERDQGKRPLMGEIVSRVTDYAIVTNEDPYGEDPQKIIEEVFSGLLKSGKMEEMKNCWKILDRRLAIRKGLQLAQAQDILLVTGKGAEETMAVSATERITWNDRRVIEEELEKIIG